MLLHDWFECDGDVVTDVDCFGLFQELNNSVLSSQASVNRGGVSGPRAPSELTIFPPVGVALPADRSSVVQFEPLPDIRPPAPTPAAGPAPALRKPPVFHNQKLSPEDWFGE